MNCKECFYLSTASNKKFCYLKLAEVTKECKDILLKECKLCLHYKRKKCLLNKSEYPKVCSDFKRMKNWAMKLE